MRFMIMVKATKDTEAGKFPDNAEKLFEAMQVYHDELVKAGVLLDASGLQPSSAGWKVKFGTPAALGLGHRQQLFGVLKADPRSQLACGRPQYPAGDCRLQVAKPGVLHG